LKKSRTQTYALRSRRVYPVVLVGTNRNCSPSRRHVCVSAAIIRI